MMNRSAATLRLVKSGNGDQEHRFREFLPAALEILETPPSPIHVAFLWIICALVVAALGWAYLGRVDIVAAAQGKFQPTGRVKVVEPLETGRVEDVRAANGSLVKAGDILVELDRSAAEADVEGPRAERGVGGRHGRREDDKVGEGKTAPTWLVSSGLPHKELVRV